MAYTYKDFEDEARKTGLLGQFSGADLALARADPDAGMSLLSYKKDYAGATTDAQRALANTGAEGIRNQYGGYTGGMDGSKYYKTAPSGSGSGVNASTGYSSPYAGQIQSLYDDIRNSSFSWDADRDPGVQAYRKAYTREGDRAARDTLGSAAAMTGGIASTSAVAASQQAQNYYGAQMSDKEAQLYQQAYDNYLSGVSQKLNQLSVLGQLEGRNYDVYNSEQNFRQNSQLLEQENTAAARDDARAQLQAVLEAGRAPSEALWDAAGYDPTVRSALTAMYGSKSGTWNGTLNGAGAGSVSQQSAGGTGKQGTLSEAQMNTLKGRLENIVHSSAPENAKQHQMEQEIMSRYPMMTDDQLRQLQSMLAQYGIRLM